jgi:hypothetical protein
VPAAPAAVEASLRAPTRRVLGRGTYRAFRLSNAQVAILAEGELPNLTDQADIQQSPLRIFPPRFDLFFLQQPISAPTTRPFRIVEVFGFPPGQETLIVRDADGPHTVRIEALTGSALAAPSNENTRRAFSRLSLQDAFDAAVAQLPPPDPGQTADALVTYTLRSSGKVEGGIAGFNHYFADVEISTT